MDKQVTILGLSGSLRKGSYNSAMIRTAIELAPADAKVEVFDLSAIPVYNMDLEATAPASVKDFKARIKAADAILIATPEHNYSIPGMLKNAIDWASRPYGDNSFAGKPAAILSASTGILGGCRAQYHLRQVMVFLDMHPLNKPEVMVGLAAEKFNAQGKLTDDKARQLIAAQLRALVDWTNRLNPR